MRIRRAGPVDLLGIHQVEKACFSDPWPLFGFFPYVVNRQALVLVAEESRIIGFVLALQEGGELHIHNLAVVPEHRRKGVASALLHRLFAEASQVRRVRLEVRASNLAAQAFYKKHGFREEAVLPGYYQDGEDGILMICDLDPG